MKINTYVAIIVGNNRIRFITRIDENGCPLMEGCKNAKKFSETEARWLVNYISANYIFIPCILQTFEEMRNML